MKRITVPAFALALLLCGSVKAQHKVGDDPTNVNSSAVFEMQSTNKGMLLPRVALTATNSATPLSGMVTGMAVYNTATAGSGETAVSPGYYYCDGTKWVASGANLNNISITNNTTPAGSTGQIVNIINNTGGLPIGPAYWDGDSWETLVPGDGGSSTASNGLTAVSGDIRLGGTLSSPTTINQANNDMTFTTGTGKMIVDGTLQTNGAVYAKVRKVTAVPITWADDDYMVIVSVSGSQNLNLPSPGGSNAGRVICIRNNSVEAGAGGTYSITVNIPVNNTSIAISRGAIFVSDGTSWYLIAGV